MVKKQQKSGEINLEALMAATEKMAWIVETYGDIYWPLFDRLDRELRQRQARDDRLKRYTLPLTSPQPAKDQRESMYDFNSSETG